MNKRNIFALLVLCLLGFQMQANAIENVVGDEPGLLNKQLQQQIRDYEIEKKVIDTTEADIEKENKIRDKEKQQEEKDVVKGELTYNPKFLLKEVVFEGNTVYSDKRLKKLAKDLIGKEVYLDDIMNLTLKVSRYYQKNGYITSFAYLDAQEIKDGVVKINIKESRITKKECIGNKWERDRYLNNFVIGGHGLNYNNVFNARALQGAMKNINNSSYMNGSVAISRNENNDTEIKLNVQDRFPISLDMGWDDFGRNYTGRQRFTTVLGMDNLTGFGDRIYGGAILGQDSKGVLAGYEIPVGRWGTRLGFDFSHSTMDLGGPYRNYGIKGSSNDYILRLTQPIKNTATQDINLTVAFDWLNSKSDSEYLGPLSDYSLRVLRTRLNGMFDDRYGRTLVSLGFDLGIDGMGATESIGGVAESAFYKIIASLARVQRLPKECLGILRVNGQYSGQSLYPTEQMFLGGAYSLRGYQPSELLGDYGVAGSLEIRTPIPGIKAIFPKKYEDSWARKVRLVFFYDWGYVNCQNGNYDSPTNFLHSVGVGTNINITDAISFQIGIGFPLSKKMDENSGRLYFSINTELDKLFMKPKARL